jgi:hypothetical protein
MSYGIRDQTFGIMTTTKPSASRGTCEPEFMYLLHVVLLAILCNQVRNRLPFSVSRYDMLSLTLDLVQLKRDISRARC